MRLLIGTLAALSLTASAANAAVLVNGGFESSTLTPGQSAQMSSNGYASLAAGSTSITGWSIGGAGVDYVGALWVPAGGTHSIDLNALGAGSIYQSISTVIGQAYTISFDLAGNPLGAPIVKLAISDISGQPGAAYLFDTTGKTTSAMGWTTFAYDFTAQSTTSTLTFSNSNQGGFNTAYGAALDNVSITEALPEGGAPGGVPEPATWALMLLGFGGVGLGLRQRRARAA